MKKLEKKAEKKGAIVDLIKTRTFKTNEHKLANKFRLSDYDARYMLSETLLINRFKDTTNDELKRLLAAKDKHTLWKITHARQDVERNYLKQIKADKAIDYLKLSVKTTDYADYKANKKDNRIELVIKLLPKIFSHKSTQRWVGLVLEHGKAETKKVLNQTQIQFKNKMYQTELYCEQHRDKIDKVFKENSSRKYVHELNILREFINLIESLEYSEDKFQDLINVHIKYVDDLVGQIPMIYSPLLLIQDWKIACLKDKYKLINKIYDRADKVKRLIEC